MGCRQALVGVKVRGVAGLLVGKQPGACGGYDEWWWWLGVLMGSRQAGVSVALRRCAGEVLICRKAPHAFSLNCMQAARGWVIAPGLC